MKKISNFISWIVIFVLIGGLTMARGTPDDGQSLSSSPIGQVSDLGEATNHILMGGGANSRTGRWVWASGFEGYTGQLHKIDPIVEPPDMKFVFGTLGSVVQGRSDAAFIMPSWQGKNMLALLTTGVIGNVSGIWKYFPQGLQTGKWGLETMIALPAAQANVDIQFTVNLPNPSLVGRVRIAIGAGPGNILLQFQDHTGAFVTLLNLGNVASLNSGVYYNLKMVIDVPNKRYARVSWNNNVFNFETNPTLAANSGLLVGGAAPDDQSYLQLLCTTLDANQKLSLVDNLILTSDEP